MKLLQAQVQNFRSIVDSEIVEIDDRVTVLIGKNEQGKTNFLRGLASFNEKYLYSPGDLPHHLRPSLESKKSSDIPIVTLWLALNSEEINELSTVANDIKDLNVIKITRYYDGHYVYSGLDSAGVEAALEFTPPSIDAEVQELIAVATGLKAKLTSHAARLTTFAPYVQQSLLHIENFLEANFKEHAQIENLIKTMTTALMGVPGIDQPILDDINAATRDLQAKWSEIQRIVQRDKQSPFKSKIPKFIFHSTSLDQIPNHVSIAEFVKDPENTSKGMYHLCQAAGLSIQKIQVLSADPEASAREPYEDHYKAAISGAINEFWSQQSYTVSFRIDKERLSVSIEDSTYTRRVPPSDRSDGFRWYLSFYSTLMNEVSTNEQNVLLLDNPGLELHPDGQWDIKRSIEEKHSASMQVIYATHSPAMIDPFNLEQVRRVDLLENLQGSKVRRLDVKEGKMFDLLEPVRTAVGASLVTTLMTNKFNLLGEGAADRPILEAAVMLFANEMKNEILVSGSVAESLEMFPAFLERAKLPYVVHLDSDNGGRAIESKLKAADIPAEKILSLRTIFNDTLFPNKDFELEDLISDDFYAKAVSEAYPDRNVTVTQEGEPKRVQRYEAEFKSQYSIGFNKRRVSEKIKLISIRDGFDEPSSTNLKKLIDTIINALSKQKPA